MKRQPLHFSFYKLIWIFIDIILIFGISLLGLINAEGIEDFVKNIGPIMIYCGSISLVSVITFIITGVYRMVTKNFGLVESIKTAFMVFVIQVAGFLVLGFVRIYPSFKELAISYLISAPLLAFLIPSIRLFRRVLNILVTTNKKRKGVRTLIIGAGSSGKIAIDEARSNQQNHNKIIAFVDDDKEKIGGLFAGVPIHGPIAEIKTMINALRIEEVIIAISNLDEHKLKDIITLLDNCNVRIKRMPLLSEMSGPNDHTIIDVDLESLLCRDPVILDNKDVENMLNKNVVMVTGAGGSIGSELVRQIFKTHPSKIILFDIYENSTYDIEQELKYAIREQKIDDVEVIALIGSTYNEKRIENVIKKYRPNYIYHAAAYKHVPLMEDSPMEAIRTNVIGTYNVACLALKYEVKKMILVSTDKAVRPTNVMGATKRFAEMIIQYFSSISNSTAYAAVRFGNVLGSNGSVVPLFEKQIAKGGPITLTSKEIIRYFMTIPEAVSLILQSSLFAKHGEIFILDMGQPVKIIDLAEKLIRQSGLIPYKDIDIVVTGLRPGEKLYEELLINKAIHKKTSHDKIYVEAKTGVKEIKEDIATISKAFDLERNDDIKDLLAMIIESYRAEKRND